MQPPSTVNVLNQPATTPDEYKPRYRRPRAASRLFHFLSDAANEKPRALKLSSTKTSPRSVRDHHHVGTEVVRTSSSSSNRSGRDTRASHTYTHKRKRKDVPSRRTCTWHRDNSCPAHVRRPRGNYCRCAKCTCAMHSPFPLFLHFFRDINKPKKVRGSSYEAGGGEAHRRDAHRM